MAICMLYPEPTDAASVRRLFAFGMIMDRDTRLKRLRFRAWHRGTKEADLLIGGFFDAHSAAWDKDQIDWFETLIEEQDVDIMGWAIGSIAVPPRFDGSMMAALKTVGYVPISP
jgi:antitoxin CptB